jgi:hypothetical protein
VDDHVEEAANDGAEDAAEDRGGRYLPTSRLTRDTLDPGDVG